MKHILLSLIVSWLFGPSGLHAQTCTLNSTNGMCANPGAVCRPIANPDKSSASKGHCKTTIGPHPIGNTCDCLGKLDVSPPPPPPPQIKDFDVVTTFVDANQFPLNPKWGQQVRDNTLPSPKASCPVDSTQTRDWTTALQCTSYPVTFNGASGSPCGHHANFLTITYEGTVAWNGGPTHLWPFGDQDYSFNVTRDDAALYSTAGAQAHAEFDSTETVNNWDGTGVWWDRFHHSGVDQGDDRASQMVNGHHVIVVGLLGMDTYHDAKTELHPVYAMFVLLNEDRTSRQSIWAFFVRNWGNEGYCGGDQENMFAQPIRIQVPHVPGLGPATVVTTMELVSSSSNTVHGARNTDNLSGMSMSAQPNGDGMLLTFDLLAPDKQSWWMGDLTFRETKLALTAGTQPVPATKPEEGFPPAFESLRAQLDKLPESAQKQLLAQQQKAVPIKPGESAPPTIIAEPTQLGNKSIKAPGMVVGASDLVRPSKDSEGELNRSKQLEILKKDLAERGIAVTF